MKELIRNLEKKHRKEERKTDDVREGKGREGMHDQEDKGPQSKESVEKSRKKRWNIAERKD